MTPLETTLLGSVGAGWLLVGYFVRLFFRGEVVTRREHSEAMAQRDGLIKTLREQVQVKDDLNAQLAEQNGVLMGSAVPTVNAVMNALRQAAGDDPT
jgi:hypothetical protein